MRRISSAPVYPAAPTIPTRSRSEPAAREAEAAMRPILARVARVVTDCSALGVLEPLASARLTVLLALFLAGVAGEKPRLFEAGATLGVDGDEGSRDAVPHGVGLGAVPAAGHGGLDVVLVEHFDELERLAHDHARRLSLEVLIAGHAVHLELARAGLHPNAGDGGLSFAGRVGGFLLVCAHLGSLLRSWRRAASAAALRGGGPGWCTP